jgi:hypothetical protein
MQYLAAAAVEPRNACRRGYSCRAATGACALHMRCTCTAHALHCTCTALQARQLLVSRDGQIATVGAKGSRVTSLLDLAIDFNNIEFVACAAALRPSPSRRARRTHCPSAPTLLTSTRALGRHPFSQGILDEMWMGRSPEGHRVRLTKMEGIFKLALQELAMCMGVQFVEVNVNDLYSWPKGVKDKAATSGGTIKARALAPVSRAASPTWLAISLPSF